jgi:hypothetical protein
MAREARHPGTQLLGSGLCFCIHARAMHWPLDQVSFQR